MILLFLGRKAEAIRANRKLRHDPASFMPGMESNPRDNWYQRHHDYACGRIGAKEFLKAAGKCRPKQCEVHFLIGLMRLSEGDRAGARDHFRKCEATRFFIYWDYLWARAFFQRLEEDRRWPPWITLQE